MRNLLECRLHPTKRVAGLKTGTWKTLALLAAIIALTCYLGSYAKQHEGVHLISPLSMSPDVVFAAEKKPVVDSNPEHAYIMTKRHGDIIWQIYGLESTWGKNDG